MNLPTKLTVSRIFLSIIIIILLIFPFHSVGIQWLTFKVDNIVISLQYVIAGLLFIVASVTDFLDGNLARKNNQVTDLGKMLDAIADKALVNPILIILAANGFIHCIIPVIIVFRDIIVDAIKMEAASKGKVVAAIGSGKLKTASMMVGISLVFFYNMPFEFYNIRVDLFLLYFACIMSVISAFQYYFKNKSIIFPKTEK